MRSVATHAVVMVSILLVALGCKEQPPEPAATGEAQPPAAVPAPPAPAPAVAEAPAAAEPPVRARPAVLAGSWYPGDVAALRRAVQGYIAGAGDDPGPRVEGRLVGLVAPHAGYRFSGATAGHAYAALAAARPTRVVLLGPSHRVPLRGVAVPSASHFETPLGAVPLDEEALSTLLKHAGFELNDAAHAQEHSLEIQLPFLQEVLGSSGWTLVPLVVGRLDEAGVRAAAAAIQPLLDEHTVIIASSDFTHFGPNYGYQPFAGPGSSEHDVPARLRALDMGAWEKAAARDVPGLFAYKAETGATICGFLPIAILVAALPADAKGTLLHYDTSGAVTGDWSNSVSYVSAAFTVPAAAGRAPSGQTGATGSEAAKNPLTDAEKGTLLRLARDAAESYVRERRTIDPLAGGYAITERLREDSGAFVTLKREGRLRGCIGEILPRRPLYLVVRDHAIDAAVNDSRFRPVTAEELPLLHLEVSVLTPPRRVAGWQDIVIGRHGVFLTKGVNRAVFLPQVAPEQGWDRDETLNHLARKAGLPTDAWRSGAQFDVFEAIVFGEEPDPSQPRDGRKPRT